MALPATLIGLLFAIIYRPKKWQWSDGCLEAITRPFGGFQAQTHGWIIYYRDDSYRRNESMRVHERVHVLQGFVGGPLFLLAYGLHFIWLFAKKRSFQRAYRAVWAEKKAYDIQWEFSVGLRPYAWGSYQRKQLSSSSKSYDFDRPKS